MWVLKQRAAVTQLLLLLGACSALLPEVTACVAEMLEANLWFYFAPTIHSLTFNVNGSLNILGHELEWLRNGPIGKLSECDSSLEFI